MECRQPPEAQACTSCRRRRLTSRVRRVVVHRPVGKARRRLVTRGVRDGSVAKTRAPRLSAHSSPFRNLISNALPPTSRFRVAICALDSDSRSASTASLSQASRSHFSIQMRMRLRQTSWRWLRVWSASPFRQTSTISRLLAVLCLRVPAEPEPVGHETRVSVQVRDRRRNRLATPEDETGRQSPEAAGFAGPCPLRTRDLSSFHVAASSRVRWTRSHDQSARLKARRRCSRMSWLTARLPKRC